VHPLTGTEICYCILSLTAKMYLGWFLLLNVLFVDGSTADETLQGSNAEAR
jgi:prepilin-type processing-associated H-X9-DG protein